MPIYEYQCTACRHTFDVLQKLSDDPLIDCRECGAPKLRKLVSAPNFRLKGAGWYETDFKDKNKRNLAGDDGKPDGAKADDKGADSGAPAKTDAKSADSKPAAGKAADAKASGEKPAAKSGTSKSDKSKSSDD